MTRVIHTGDTHLGYRQYHAPERRDDFLAAFRQVVADAVEEDVDAVIHAGDLFHDRRPDLTDLLGTLSVLRTLSDADIPFLAIVGNHEHTRGHQWLELFETLGLATRLDDGGTVVGDTTFYGLDHVPRSKRDDLDYRFADHGGEHAALVAHGLFTPFTHGDWNTETVLSESNLDFDAMLLGDNHIPDTAEIRDTWVTYCGSTERTSASERDPRGYNIVEFGKEVQITRRGLDTRDFVFIDLELGETEGLDRVRERIREEEVENAVVIVTLEGEGDGIAPASIEEFAAERGALVARVNDHREIEAEAPEYGVSFADPDDAVRERVRELGLSSAARGIDETVRESKTADSNVREVVETRIAELIEDEPEAFVAATDSDVETETMADRMTGGSEEPPESDEAVESAGTADPGEAGATSDAASDGEPEPAEATPDGGESHDDDPDLGGDGTGIDEPSDDAGGDGTGSDEPTDGASAASASDDTDGQSSMEEYL